MVTFYNRYRWAFALLMLAIILPVTTHAITKVKVVAPASLDFEPVAIDEATVTALTDLTGERTVQVTNGTDVTLCVSVDADATPTCAGETLTCTGGDNFTVILAGASKSWLVPKGSALCGKMSAAPTGIVTVEEIPG